MLKKNRFLKLLLTVVIISLTLLPIKANAYASVANDLTYASFVNEQIPNLNVKGAILVNSDTGRIIYAFNEHQKLAPASITKLMTVYIVLEKIHQGTLSWQQPVTASLNAASIEEAQVYLSHGETYSLREMTKAMMIPSANDAAVAIAEMVAGSEPAFVKLMNEKAKELGLSESHFINVTGLPTHTANDDHHYMSAYDIAKLARTLISQYPEILEFTKMQNATFRNGAYSIRSTNNLLGSYAGMDGLKTGFTNRASLCLAATAKRDNTRLISVVLGAPTDDSRKACTTKLLDYGFSSCVMEKTDPLPFKGTLLLPWMLIVH